MEEAKMPRYVVTLTEEEEKELKTLIQKGGKGVPDKARPNTAEIG